MTHKGHQVRIWKNSIVEMQIRKYYHLQDGLKDLTDWFPSQQSTVMESSYSAHFLNVTSYVLASNWKKPLLVNHEMWIIPLSTKKKNLVSVTIESADNVVVLGLVVLWSGDHIIKWILCFCQFRSFPGKSNGSTVFSRGLRLVSESVWS
jgi:hypothetical protein